MTRPVCPKCGGFIVMTIHVNQKDSPHVKCLICGWRKYPEALTVDDEFDGYLRLIVAAYGDCYGRIWL